MLVHPNRVPDVTLSIDVYGSLATRNQHRTLAEVGFDDTLRVLRADVERMKREPYGEQLTWLGTKHFNGRSVEGVALLSGKRIARTELSKAGEALFAFARRVDMETYPIFLANPSLSALATQLEAERAYVVPAYRASRIEYWFETQTGMLLRQVAWNEQGKVFESYEHFEMVLNPKLTAADFDPKNPAYGF